jgi:hypothetical protein
METIVFKNDYIKKEICEVTIDLDMIKELLEYKKVNHSSRSSIRQD